MFILYRGKRNSRPPDQLPVSACIHRIDGTCREGEKNYLLSPSNIERKRTYIRIRPTWVAAVAATNTFTVKSVQFLGIMTVE